VVHGDDHVADAHAGGPRSAYAGEDNAEGDIDSVGGWSGARVGRTALRGSTPRVARRTTCLSRWTIRAARRTICLAQPMICRAQPTIGPAPGDSVRATVARTMSPPESRKNVRGGTSPVKRGWTREK
jgi:hypothetical protein